MHNVFEQILDSRQGERENAYRVLCLLVVSPRGKQYEGKKFTILIYVRTFTVLRLLFWHSLKIYAWTFSNEQPDNGCVTVCHKQLGRPTYDIFVLVVFDIRVTVSFV